MNDSRLTILVDNNAGPGLTAEHGLAFWIETDGVRILFDTGQGGALQANARTLGIDLGTTDLVVLSHGHYDHTGGIPGVITAAPEVRVYCGAGAGRIRYAIRDGAAKAIHMPEASRMAISGLPMDRIHWMDRPVSLTRSVNMTGSIPRLTPYEDTGGPFYLDSQGTTPDLLEDDRAIWIATKQGIVTVAGCCHAGLVNTLREIKRLSGGMRISAVIGGFHLGAASPYRLEQTVKELIELAPDKIIPCHCTGDDAAKFFRDSLGEHVTLGYSGMSLTF